MQGTRRYQAGGDRVRRPLWLSYALLSSHFAGYAEIQLDRLTLF